MSKNSKRGKASEQNRKKIKGIKLLKKNVPQSRISADLDVSLPAVKKWGQELNNNKTLVEMLMEVDPKRGPRK